MTFSVCRFGRVLLLLAGVVLSGCLPDSQSQLAEEKEPHFLAGKSRVNALDYKGAIESFEKALEVNPQSASAHFESGCLCQQREVADPAAAIYHFERFLRLRPKAENAEIVGQRIMACKQELARTVSLGPVTEKVQRELEQLTEEKQRLAEQNKTLQEDLEKWRAYALRLQGLTNQAGSLPPTRPAAQAETSIAPGSGNPASPLSGAAPALRTHTVKPGETPTSIARQHGIKVEALLATNPRLDPRRLRVGQTLNIPKP